MPRNYVKKTAVKKTVNLSQGSAKETLLSAEQLRTLATMAGSAAAHEVLKEKSKETTFAYAEASSPAPCPASSVARIANPGLSQAGVYQNPTLQELVSVVHQEIGALVQANRQLFEHIDPILLQIGITPDACAESETNSDASMLSRELRLAIARIRDLRFDVESINGRVQL